MQILLPADRQRFQIFHPLISLSHKNFLFGKFLMTSLHVICNLGLPQSKILATPMNWRSCKNFFEDLFFWRTLAAVSLVLGLKHFCPWPREGLSSEKLSLAWIFLCPWPRAFCPRLHLWYLVTSNNQTAVISKASHA